MASATSSQFEPDLKQMRADAMLPADVQPCREGAMSGARGLVLLTGGTGFVGAYVLHALLRDTPAVVLCLVRWDPRNLRGSPADRLRRNLEARGLWEPAWAERIRPLAGDLGRPGLGWSEKLLGRLAESIDAIYHAGAVVNWVLPYAGLRAVNVQGTLELLRLASRTRAKPFHFLSTIGVCYATTLTRTLTEDDDPWPLLDQLHLGYAQSKAVAEELVRQARQRGLPAVIYRPGLITGDSRSGDANANDFLARGIGACVRMGCAPDVDWSIDAPPVDYVARVVVACHPCSESEYRLRTRMAPTWQVVGEGSTPPPLPPPPLAPPPLPPPQVLHLLHPQRRPWRELVLWMRLYGYPLQLASYQVWLRHLEGAACSPEHPLHPMLGFFLARVGGVSLPETYLGQRRSQVSAERTLQTLADMGLDCPTLDAGWLERFFGSLTAAGVVPPRPGAATCRPGVLAHGSGGAFEWEDCLPDLLRRHFDDPTLGVSRASTPVRLSRQSILTELTTWQSGSTAGLFRQRLDLTSQRARGNGGGTPPHDLTPSCGVVARLEVVIKVKTEDKHLLDVAEAAAALCDPAVGAAFTRWRSRLGLTGGRLREISLYQQDDERWRRWTPRTYGSAWDEERRRGLLILEDLSATTWMDCCTEAQVWQPIQIEAAVRGLAELHAIWFERSSALFVQPWLGPVFNAATMVEMTDLWTALANHAAPFFVAWLGPDVCRLQQGLLTRLERWWSDMEQLPHTLIHNDFNPRNLALRQGPTGPLLCAYDWELAAWSIPQHDLAELLCFVLPADCSRQSVRDCLELHRQTLERAAGCRLDVKDWEHGFGLALADLLVNRLAMYALVHSIRPQPFLERVLRMWRTLRAFYPGD
jgi:thioester reductase-like protein